MSALRVALTWVGVAVLALVTAVVLVSCGASLHHRSSDTAEGEDLDADLGSPNDARDEVMRLEAETDALARELGLPFQDDDGDVCDGAEPMSVAPSAAEASGTGTCPGRDLAACTDSCRLSDAICRNSDSICRLAEETGGDSWGTDRCRRSKAICARARERCCGCS